MNAPRQMFVLLVWLDISFMSTPDSVHHLASQDMLLMEIMFVEYANKIVLNVHRDFSYIWGNVLLIVL